MAPTNDIELRQYLNSKDIPCSEVEALTGGTANYVWRIRTLLGRCSIVKHAEPYVRVDRIFPFPVVRMDFEAKALRELPELLERSEETVVNDRIVLPKFIHYDADAHVITMGDGGSRTLKSAYIKDDTLDIASLGRKIGDWLAHLHSCARVSSHRAEFNNKVGKSAYRYCYQNLASAFEANGFDKALGERVNEKYGSLLEEIDDVCVCHGDFWPGNIFLSDHVEDKDRVLTVADWEMVRNGEGATDVGQFAAEAWLLDRFHGGRGLLDAFLTGYMDSRKLDPDSAIRVAVQIGTHLGFWPTRVEWGNKEETKEIVGHGYRILKAIEEEDWEYLRGSGFGRLFEE
ncbi:Protein kinase-like domain [Venturia nashicola]|nr:Protein kinase-like domain [Venturia nashicola]